MFQRVIKCIINWFALVLLVIISFIVLFLSNDNYTYKKNYILPNFGLMLLGIIALLIFLFVIKKCIGISKRRVPIYKISIVAFGLQYYVCSNIYFYTSWDVAVILKAARKILAEDYGSLWHDYFSWYPNNHFILWIDTVILRINRAFGIYNYDNEIMAFILAQCLLTTITGILLFDVIKNCTDSEAIALTGWMIYMVLIEFSGWIVIPYTDMMGIIVPMSILRIYQSLHNGRGLYLKWVVMVSLAYWGYKLKPQILIVFIAILIIEIINSEYKEYTIETIKKITITIGMSVVCLVVCSCIFTYIVKSTGLIINPEKNMGITHMVMMGLNDETDGMYYQPDVDFTQNFDNKAEKKEAQISIIKERISNYGLGGLLKHLYKKTLVNFNDGSFAWLMEDDFYSIEYEDRNSVASPLLKDFYYSSRSKNIYLRSLEQMVWLAVLLLSIGAIKNNRNDISVVMLTILGMILFCSVFEARARYLIIYVPFFIIAAMCSLMRLSEYFNTMKMHERDEENRG